MIVVANEAAIAGFPEQKILPAHIKLTTEMQINTSFVYPDNELIASIVMTKEITPLVSRWYVNRCLVRGIFNITGGVPVERIQKALHESVNPDKMNETGSKVQGRQHAVATSEPGQPLAEFVYSSYQSLPPFMRASDRLASAARRIFVKAREPYNLEPGAETLIRRLIENEFVNGKRRAYSFQ